MPTLVLCVLDGWGMNDSEFGNAIKAAKTPNFNFLDSNYPPISLAASGEEVGLPEGQMGNSEVGHLNIGAGRVVKQNLPKISGAIKDGSFFSNKAIDAGVKKALKDKVRYHLLGLVSDGGVHSHINHIEALLKKCKMEGLTQVYIHALMDGRDTPPSSGADYMKRLLDIIDSVGVGKVATVHGRYYAMDRDNRWDRVEKSYNAMIHGRGVTTATDPVEAITASYNNGITDEFINPCVMVDGKGEPVGTIREGDVVMLFNFRPDRVRQLLGAFTQETFDGFDRGPAPGLHVYCMTNYGEVFNLPVAFKNSPPKNTLGELICDLKIPQFRTAETEKYPHVTYFLNGGVEKSFAGEVRKMIPSPKVATYDLKPEMSAKEVTDQVVEAVASARYGLIVVNLANGDMVGHTGMFDAAMKAVETVDSCVGRMMEAVKKVNGFLIVTADHGNIEQMLDDHNNPVTAHSTNLVPFYLFGREVIKLSQKGGALCDIAPTALAILKIPKPEEMTGVSLIVTG